MPQPSNEWEQTYEASIRREEEAVQALPNWAFHKFLIDLRWYLLAATAVISAVISVGQHWGFYWIAVGAFFVIGAFIWRRYSHRNRR